MHPDAVVPTDIYKDESFLPKVDYFFQRGSISPSPFRKCHYSLEANLFIPPHYIPRIVTTLPDLSRDSGFVPSKNSIIDPICQRLRRLIGHTRPLLSGRTRQHRRHVRCCCRSPSCRAVPQGADDRSKHHMTNVLGVLALVTGGNDSEGVCMGGTTACHQLCRFKSLTKGSVSCAYLSDIMSVLNC